MGTLLTIVVVLAVVAVVCIAIFNGLIGRRNRVDQAYASIDVMLKKRYDLIPNLVATVERYMTHERELLSELTELRTRAISGDLPPAQRLATDSAINGALGRLIVSAESYPELKANQNFLQLQASLNEVEEQLSASRRAYNAAVTDYNSAIQMIPGSLFAGPMGLQQRPLFAAAEAERRNVDVGELFQRR
jgi:LemA protein